MRVSILPMFPQMAFWIVSLVVVHYLTKSSMKVAMVMDQTSPDSEPVPADSTVHEQSPDVIWKKAPKTFEYSRHMPILFIGGMPHSGTTLMRSIMDAHPMMRCGEQTRLVELILDMRSSWYRSEVEKKRLTEAGVGELVVNAAISDFILEVLVKSSESDGKPAERLCNKDPFAVKSMKYLIDLFPNGRFILMVRDGRAAAHSLMSRQVPINGKLRFTRYRDVLTEWNKVIKEMYALCIEVGATYCHRVHYEDLVLHPRKTLQGILDFADMPWHDFVMEHEKHIGNISLTGTERSTDQVVKPIYTDSVKSWVGKIGPDDVLRDMPEIAPMLSVLGYDPRSHDPFYGKPDTEVVEKYEQWVQLHSDQA